MNSELAATAVAEPRANTGFGATGWRMIIFSIFMYFAYAGWCADGINIFSPALAAKNGWEVGKLLTLVAPGGLLGVVGAGFFGQVVIKKGPRFVMTLCMAASAIAVFWFGRITTLWEFAVVFMIINFFASGYGFIATGTLMNNWFPRKKGMALAIATSGFPLATAIFVPLIAVMFNKLGIAFSTTIWTGLFLVGAVLAWVIIRDNPEEVGCYPDNDPTEDRASIDAFGHVVDRETCRLLLVVDGERRCGDALVRREEAVVVVHRLRKGLQEVGSPDSGAVVGQRYVGSGLFEELGHERWIVRIPGGGDEDGDLPGPRQSEEVDPRSTGRVGARVGVGRGDADAADPTPDAPPPAGSERIGP